MTGFVRPRTLKLTWADGEFAGLEIRARRSSLETYFQFAPILDGGIDVSTPDGRKEFLDLFLEFGEYLVSWNLEDENEHGTRTPIPCTPQEFLNQDPRFVREVLDQWADAIAGVAAPLDSKSASGEPFPEASLPMDALSPSLAS
ncbi:hypothetical protein [Nonomuraea sp. SBT364]|uniref:hypothetical protein n=1 Tax=Nonomuraea sp. SBT364 TaxID=1580530 RepID=UPI00066BE67B|nr:hypothetical protein [Nonomuraea sp. SBT364]